MTVQQFKARFNRHPHASPGPSDKDGVTLPAPPQGLRGPLPASGGPVPVPPGGFQTMPNDPSLFDMPGLRV
jgi:hypothetical protein